MKKDLLKEGWQTTKKERVKFYIGDIGRACSGSIVTTFMSMFLMLQGLPLQIVAVALVLVNIVDSVDDVVFGYLVDKLNLRKCKFLAKITGEGKYLPWFRLAFPLFPIFTICFFLMPAGFSVGAKIVWFIVFDLLYDFAYTIVEVPMNSIVITLTDNLDERNAIIQTKTILSSLTVVIIPMIWLVLVSQAVGIPLVIVAVVSAVIFFFFMLPLTKGVKEHNTELKNVEEGQNEHYTFKEMFKCIKENKYFLLLVLSLFFNQALATSAGSVGLFASFYLYGNELILTIPVLLSFPLVIAAQLLTRKLVNKHGKRKTLITGGAIGCLGTFGIYIVGLIGINQALSRVEGDTIIHLGIAPMYIFIICALLVFQAAPGNASNMVRGFMLPDTIEYGRYKNGHDCAGIFTSINSFITKLCTSIASSTGLFILGLSGWKPINATDFADLARQAAETPEAVAQPVSTVNMLWIIFTLIPLIGTALNLITMCFYNLKDKDVQLMAECNAGKMTKEECEAQLSRHYGKNK